MSDFIDARVIIGVLFGYILCSLITPYGIKILKILKYGQNIRSEGPKAHETKSGTPTMGGVIFILVTCVITIFMFLTSFPKEIIFMMISFVAFGFIGFTDDILKIIHKNNLGLRAYQKSLMLLAVSFLLAISLDNFTSIGHDIIIPFYSRSYDLGPFFIPFIMLFFIAVTNAVNLTDGLDGLSTSVSIIVIAFFSIVSLKLGFKDVSIFGGILIGSLLGFLRYNAFPAQIFMGDTGSIGLGGVIAMMAILLKLEIFLIIAGGIYVAETASVIIQVAYFKRTRKRIFKMAPLHHHFELSGLSETKVVTLFSIISLLLCLVSFLAF